MSLPAFAATAKRGNVLMIVDDEPSILQALTSLFSRTYSVVTSTSPLEALEQLKGGLRPQVILSDNRMPELMGIEFLSRTMAYSPDSIRAIMTGFAEIREILTSINKGTVYMYLSKPWQIAEILQAVRLCFLHYEVTQRNGQLLRETETQTTVLAQLRGELVGTNVNLDETNLKTMADLRLTAEALGGLLSSHEDYYYDSGVGNHAGFVARVSRKVAEAVGFKPETIPLIEIAAYLHDMGKAELPRSVRAPAPDTLTGADRALYESHVKRALQYLDGVSQFELVREIITQHHERADASGFPVKMGGRQLLREGQVLAMVDTYHNLVYRLSPMADSRRQSGDTVTLLASELADRQRQATVYFNQNRQLFDPLVLQAFVAVGTAGNVEGFRLFS